MCGMRACRTRHRAASRGAGECAGHEGALVWSGTRCAGRHARTSGSGGTGRLDAHGARKAPGMAGGGGRTRRRRLGTARSNPEGLRAVGGGACAAACLWDRGLRWMVRDGGVDGVWGCKVQFQVHRSGPASTEQHGPPAGRHACLDVRRGESWLMRGRGWSSTRGAAAARCQTQSEM